jgi:hypothetical protein
MVCTLLLLLVLGQEPIPGIGPKSPVEKVAGGFAFTEGPAADGLGNLYFSDIPNARIHKLDAKGKAGWEALKKTAREESTKRAELERQIEDWKSKGRDPETLEKHLSERDKRIADYEERVARVDLELTESFKRDITEPRQKEIGKAKALADEMEVNPDEMSSALNLRGKARSNALREMGIDPDGGRISRIMDNLDELHDRAEYDRANAKQALEYRIERERLDKLSEHGEFVKTKFDCIIKI